MIDDVKIMMENEQLIEHSTEYSQLLNSELGKERIRSYISSLLPNLTAILEVRYGGHEIEYFKDLKNHWYSINRDCEDEFTIGRIFNRDIDYKSFSYPSNKTRIIYQFVHDFIDRRGSTVFCGFDSTNHLVYIIMDSCSSLGMLSWSVLNTRYIENIITRLYRMTTRDCQSEPTKLMKNQYNMLITTVNEIIHDISPHHVELDTREHDYWESGR